MLRRVAQNARRRLEARSEKLEARDGGRHVNKKQREKRLEQTRLAFAANVKTLRLRKNWTQAELAERLGVHRITIIRIESGVHQPLFSEACLMADLLGVSIAEMRHELWRG